MSIQTQRLILAVIIIAGIIGLVAASLFLPLSGIAVQIEDVLLGGCVVAFTQVVGFYFRRQ